MSINPPRLQAGPVLWAGVTAAGVIGGFLTLRDFPSGSDGWWASIVWIAMATFGFASIEGWWLTSQREVQIDEKHITIRRWTQVLTGQSGDVIPRQAIARAGLVIGSGKNFRVVLRSGGEVEFWVGLWEPESLRELLSRLRLVGIATENQWEP